MKKFFGNAVVFVLLYILLMVPTYVLPYFGSNSSVMLASLASANALSHAPQFLLHLGALGALVLVAWARGSRVDKMWLVVFPLLAAVFDFVPALSVVPLVPTVMHLLAIVLGVVGGETTGRAVDVPT